MVYFTDQQLEQLIRDDVPVFDLTTHLLGIGEQPGQIRFITREDTVLCCTEEAARILEMIGLSVTHTTPSGTRLDAGQPILEAKGSAAALHAGWRVAVNLLEHASGIATRTRHLVDRVHRVNPTLTVAGTRKTMPWAKNMMVKAILCGGALPHRLGLSETVLIFDEHTRFQGGLDGLLTQLPKLRQQLTEKMIVAEAHDTATAQRLAEAGVDMVQLDKFSLAETSDVVDYIQQHCPRVKVATAGGVNADNAVDYAATGIDMIVTSALYFGKPADIKADLQPL